MRELGQDGGARANVATASSPSRRRRAVEAGGGTHFNASALPSAQLPPLRTCATAASARPPSYGNYLSTANRKAIAARQFVGCRLRQFIAACSIPPSSDLALEAWMSPSYSHSAAFAALALCNPYSEVPPTRRTRGAGRLFALIRDGTSLSVGPGQSPAGRFKRLLAAGHGAFSAALRAGRHCRSAW